MSLWAEFLTNDERVIHKWTNYFPIYEKHFERYVNRPMLFLEIGCGEGGSLCFREWRGLIWREGRPRTPATDN